MKFFFQECFFLECFFFLKMVFFFFFDEERYLDGGRGVSCSNDLEAHLQK